ncbi:uncharacterized protein C8Q71DRAFT_460179 [Rhodofomes roseus]|uniref:F-box domain-containing protein n=1 Tax=Rhodofomes roseus TaxID=34475 RepID=A0ABQ8KMS4_9APHY|nr:uncharacterized protein C8Q71DRAFT_460179 [Rhodofomes roseus]KAH9839714.1 hypothetical protein C8Q71DRAFT_460179 [Rhodofomes roseus]
MTTDEKLAVPNGSGAVTSTPIALVPDDILHQVFMLVVAEAWEGRGTLSTHPWNNMTCLAISHICRYWRRFTLASPQLWSYLSITLYSGIDQLETYIKRSQGMPLYVKYTGSANVAMPNPSWGQKGVVLVDQSYRFVEFHVSEMRREDISALLSFFRKPAPLLRRLYLHAPVQLLGPSIFARDMPALRHIELSGVLLAWLPYRNMDTMILKDQLTPTLGKLLSALKDCPKLTVLKLGLLGAMGNAAIMGGMTVAGDPQAETVHLPELKELSLSSMAPVDMANILRHLVFSKTTTLDLKFYGHNNLPLELATECPSLGAIATVQENIILELIGALEWSTHIVLRSADNKLRIEWEWYEAGGLPEILDTAGFSAISFPALKHLTIFANSFRLQEAQWRQILARAPTATAMELNIRDSMVPELFAALSRAGGAEGGDAPQLVCPKLTHLKISRLEEHMTILRGMAEAIERRALHDLRLHAIDIISRKARKRFPREIETRLRRCVGSVTVKYDGPSMDFGSLSAQLYE